MTLLAAILLMLASAPSKAPVACIVDHGARTVIFRAADASACVRRGGIALETVP